MAKRVKKITVQEARERVAKMPHKHVTELAARHLLDSSASYCTALLEFLDIKYAEELGRDLFKLDKEKRSLEFVVEAVRDRSAGEYLPRPLLRKAKRYSTITKQARNMAVKLKALLALPHVAAEWKRNAEIKTGDGQ